MKAIFKNFLHVLRRFKTASALNILGLSAALVVFIVCMIQVKYDLTFNHHFPDANKTYLISQYFNTSYGENRQYNLFNKDLETLRTNIPLLDKERSTQVWMEEITLRTPNSEANFSEWVLGVESNFLNFFDLKIISGDIQKAFSNYNNLIISKETSRKLFGEESPIGKTLTINMPFKKEIEGGTIGGREDTPMTIVAVHKDFPKNCSFYNGLLCLLKPDRFEVLTDNGYSWNGSIKTYCKVNSKDNKEELSQLLADKNTIDLLRLMPPSKFSFKKDEGELSILDKKLELIPFENIQIRLPDESDKSKSITNILSLFAIGIVTLAIAYINFMNFMTAMAPIRIRTINIQKILGADKSVLKLAIIFETILLTLIAFSIALICLHFISSTTLFSHFFEASIKLEDNIGFILILTLILIFLAILVAIYPAFFLTRFNPATSYGGASIAKSSKGLRNILTIIQYTAALVLIMIALFIKLQHNYMKYNNMGLEKENVVYLNNMTAKWEKKINEPQTYIQEAIASPFILNSTTSSYLLGSGYIGTNGNVNEFKEHYYTKDILADKNFTDFFGIEIIENKDELANKDKNEWIAYNQTFMNSISDQFRQSLTGSGAMVVKDFNFDKMQKHIENLKITLNDEGAYAYFYFKLPKENIAEAIKHLESVWKKMTNEPFELQFLYEQIQQQYQSEENLASLLSIFSLIIIIIAIMGVYGLITFNSKYRAKEIAIRKVQGSNVQQIMMLLNKGILTQFLIAFVIAIPIAYCIIDKWLEQFPYKTPVYWWVFLIGALIVLVITILTVSVQSYRAATENPIDSLKKE